MREVIIFIILLALVSLGITFFKKEAVAPDVIAEDEVETQIPEPTNVVVDNAGGLTPEQLVEIQTEILNHDPEIGVLLVKTTGAYDIRQYGIKVAEKWKVGDAEKDNGLIIIIATEDRKVDIEIGYGLEGDIPDAAAGDIIDRCMVPDLKIGNWHGAVMKAIECVDYRLQS